MSDRPYLPRKYRPGDPILAADRNARNEAIARAGRLAGSDGLVVREGASSRQIALDLPECTDIKLTSSANGNGGYGAKEVLPAALGTWVDSGRVMPQGSDPAYERNKNTSLTSGDRVYRACRAETTGEWIFRHRITTSGGGGGGTFIGCLCSSAPEMLTMTVSSGCGEGLLFACSFQWGLTPAELGPLNLGAYSYLSTTTFTDPQTGDEFYYYLSCFSTIFRITRVFPSSIFAGGGPFYDAVVFYWTIGITGNTCSPFALTNGAIYFGGDPSCDVEITG